MRELERFAAALQQGDASPEQMALLIARIGYPTLRESECMAQLDVLAAELVPSLADAPHGEGRARAFLEGVTQALGFGGNHERYYEPDNSYLNVVLERRKGLPILLCVVLMALGRRLGLQVDGIGFPGHFMARYEDSGGVWFLDPFHGAVVAPQAIEAYLGRIFKRPIRLGREAFVPVTTVALALRILNNLRNVYRGSGDLDLSGVVLDYMLAVSPSSAHLWRERGVIGYRTGELESARRALRRYFYLTGRTQLLMPVQAETEHTAVMASEQPLVQMLVEIDDVLNRLN